MNLNTPVAQDLGDARVLLDRALARRPRRKPQGSWNVAISLKVSAREARALRVMARELNVDSGTGAVLLRAFSLLEVMAMYDAHLAALRRSA